jgi:hypothetical protein
MRWVEEYRRFAEECRRLAAALAKPADKRALELMAKGWDKRADQREAKLRSSDDLTEATLEPREPDADSVAARAWSANCSCR